MLKEKRKGLIEYLLLIMVFLYSGHALDAAVVPWYPKLQIYLFMSVIVIWFFSKIKKPLIESRFNWIFASVVIWAIMLLFNYIVHKSTESLNGYFMTIFIPITAFVVASEIGPEAFCQKYVKIMFVICVIALVFFYILQHLPFFESLPVLRGSDQFGDIGEKYKGLIFYYRLDEERNSGPFWEPGIFASYIVFALLFVNKYVKSIALKVIYYPVFIIALISTASSAGYILLVLVIVCILSYKITDVKNPAVGVLIEMFCFVLIVALYIGYLNLYEIFDKLGFVGDMTFDKILNISENSRMQSLEWNWQSFLDEPLFGHGFSGLQLINQEGVLNSTNTSVRLMAAMGICGLFYTILIFLGTFKQKNVSLLTKIAFFAIWLIITNKEGHDAFLMNWVLIFYFNTYNNMLDKTVVSVTTSPEDNSKIPDETVID